MDMYENLIRLHELMACFSMKVMREEWEKYLLGKIELRDLHTRYRKKPKDPKGFGILDGVVPMSPAKNVEPSSINKQEHDALVAAASEIRNRVKKDDDVNSKGGGKGKGKARNKKGPTNSNSVIIKDNGSNKIKKSSVDESDSENELGPSVAGGAGEATCQDASIDKGVLRKHIEAAEATVSETAKPLPPLHFYALESGQPILDILKPSVIVVYHPNMTFVREIEVHKAENPSKKLKVYFLFYEDSTEARKFEASIRRENGAFESLIRQKSMMMIPVDQVLFYPKCRELSELIYYIYVFLLYLFA